MLECIEPTRDREDMESLPVYDIIYPNGRWNAKSLPSEELDLQLCNQVLSLKEQRRAKIMQKPPGEPWDEADIAMW